MCSREDEEAYILMNGILLWMTRLSQEADRADSMTRRVASPCHSNAKKSFDYHVQVKINGLTYHGKANLDLEAHKLRNAGRQDDVGCFTSLKKATSVALPTRLWQDAANGTGLCPSMNWEPCLTNLTLFSRFSAFVQEGLDLQWEYCCLRIGV